MENLIEILYTNYKLEVTTIKNENVKLIKTGFIKKICFKIIDWLSKYDDRKVDSICKLVKNTDILIVEGITSTEEFHNECMKNCNYVYNITGNVPEFIVMGSVNFYKFFNINMSTNKEAAPFLYNHIFKKYETIGDVKFNGIRILIIPWINGMFCLPDKSFFEYHDVYSNKINYDELLLNKRYKKYEQQKR